ncbi:hypothetical protein GGU11DRAFT_761498, partial [Lentinula aff. detonsa]
MKSENKKAGPPGFSTNNVEWELVSRAHAADKDNIQQFSANSVAFNWADDVEETYYSDSVRSTQTTTDSSVSDSDDTGSLPDLVPVSGSEDEASISDSDDADSLPELIAVSDSDSGDEWDVEVDDGEYAATDEVQQTEDSGPLTDERADASGTSEADLIP